MYETVCVLFNINFMKNDMLTIKMICACNFIQVSALKKH